MYGLISHTICNCPINGRVFNTASCARRTRAAATNLIASVIRRVFLMDLILSFKPLLLPSMTIVELRTVVRATEGINAETVAKMANTIAKMQKFLIFLFMD